MAAHVPASRVRLAQPLKTAGDLLVRSVGVIRSPAEAVNLGHDLLLFCYLGARDWRVLATMSNGSFHMNARFCRE